MINFAKKDRSLGIAKKKRKYDLPLNKGSGGIFLKVLMGLMTILALFALSASFALSEITDRWSSGLENKATIEIPAEDGNGNILSQKAINKTSQNILSYLQNHQNVKTVEIMPEQEIKDMVSPWLGNDITFENVPLPGILSVTFKKKIDIDTKTLENRLKDFGNHVRLDTHGAWLADLLKFTGALNFAALLISTLISITTIVAVAGAVQSRMAIYDEELELLHLMGAGDRYISGQLQRYSFITCFQGSAIGALIGMVLLFFTGLVLKQKNISLIPDFDLNTLQLLVLITLPLFVALLGLITARQTVLRVLSKMP